MSGYVTHSSRALFRWVLVLTFAVTTCGCSSGFYRAYDGPELPLEEVSVLLLKEDADLYVKRIDERDIGFWDSWEYHLLPGIHEITFFYERAGRVSSLTGSYTLYKGSPVTLSFDFEKGNVYHPEARFPGALMIGKFKLYSKERGLRWTPEIIHDGTIEEVAPWRAKEWLAPHHWRELAERQLASKGEEQEQSAEKSKAGESRALTSSELPASSSSTANLLPCIRSTDLELTLQPGQDVSWDDGDIVNTTFWINTERCRTAVARWASSIGGDEKKIKSLLEEVHRKLGVESIVPRNFFKRDEVPGLFENDR